MTTPSDIDHWRTLTDSVDVLQWIRDNPPRRGDGHNWELLREVAQGVVQGTYRDYTGPLRDWALVGVAVINGRGGAGTHDAYEGLLSLSSLRASAIAHIGPDRSDALWDPDAVVTDAFAWFPMSLAQVRIKHATLDTMTRDEALTLRRMQNLIRAVETVRDQIESPTLRDTLQEWRALQPLLPPEAVRYLRRAPH